MIQKGIRGDLPGQNIATTNANIEVSSKKDKPEDNSNYMEKLEKLIDWRQKNMITEKEFQELKSQILDSISNKKQQQQTLNNQQQLTANNSIQSMNENNNDDNNKKTVDLLTYENSRIGIKIQYPVDWKLYEKEYYPDHPDEQWSQVVGFSLPSEINAHSKLENVAIYVKPLPAQNTTLEAYSNKQINHLRKKSSVHESTTTTLAGNHAHTVVYTDKKDDVIEVWTIKGDSVYTIRCAAKPEDYSTYLPIFQKMLDSFEIKK
jgi:PsbP-like protein